MLPKVLEKNVLKISRAKTKFLELRFNNKIRGNKSNHNIRLKGQLIT